MGTFAQQIGQTGTENIQCKDSRGYPHVQSIPDRRSRRVRFLPDRHNTKDENGKTILQKNGEELARFPLTRIKNDYVAKVAPGKHSLIIPLGSKATLTIRSDVFMDLPKSDYELILTDISGITWKEKITVN